MVRALERNESILQANLAERIQQIQQQHPDLQQRYFQVQLSQERRKMLNQANAPDETFEAAIGEEERQKRQQGKQQKRDSRSAGEGVKSDDPEQKSLIDIEV